MHSPVEGMRGRQHLFIPHQAVPTDQRGVFELVKKMVKLKLSDRRNDENSWLLKGRTVLIFKGGERKDPHTTAS